MTAMTTPVLWPFPQSEHKALVETLRLEDLDFTSTRRAD
jgi:hypothetical protein